MTRKPRTNAPSILRPALSLLTVRLVLRQIGLALLVFLLYAAWLRIPDASVIEVAITVLLALLILAIAGAGESALILRLCAAPRTPSKLLRGTLMVLAGTALWLAWTAFLDHFRGNDFMRAAGYANSRFTHQLRYVFTFEHILLWLGWLWTILEWIGAGVIAIFVFAATAGARPLRAIAYTVRCIAYWCAVVLVTTATTIVTGSLMNWTPGRGLRVEMLSVILRLTFAILFDAVLVCFLLATLAVCIRQADALYSTLAGTPDESQPRTVENP